MSAAETTSYRWFEKLPTLGTDADFAALRRLIDETGYTEAAIVQRLKIESVANYGAPPEGGRPIQDSLDGMIALFFDCGFVEESALAAALPPDSVPLLDRLGLLVRDPAPPGTVFASGAILTTSGVWTLCDRAGAPDGSRIPY